MGIFDFLVAGLGKEAREELAKEAAKSAVKSVGDAVYGKMDAVRTDIEESVERHRAQDRARRERAEKRKRADADAKAIDDELAALKAAIGEE